MGFDALFVQVLQSSSSMHFIMGLTRSTQQEIAYLVAVKGEQSLCSASLNECRVVWALGETSIVLVVYCFFTMKWGRRFEWKMRERKIAHVSFKCKICEPSALS